MADSNRYPYLYEFSHSIGIPTENLIKAFEIEKVFHQKILEEESFEKRQKLYEDVYNKVHPIYDKSRTDIQSGENPKDGMVRLFRMELKNKSILDIGCGEGYFLESISKNLPHRKLVGIDVSLPPLTQHHPDIEFKVADIINFNLNYKFDVVFSDQVLEHIAPVDLPMHLRSVGLSLKDGGVFIVNMPNRLFGPSDVTRIVDFTYTGKTAAQGTHLNESTYTELIPILENHGFKNCRTVCFLPKLKRFLINWRVSPWPLQVIEGSFLLLALLHRIKVRGQCIFQFGVTLICNKC